MQCSRSLCLFRLPLHLVQSSLLLLFALLGLSNIGSPILQDIRRRHRRLPFRS